VPEELRRMNAADIKKEMSPELQAELQKLAEMSDDDIDTSDIPELSEEQMANGQRGPHFRPFKAPITIRLDIDIIGWFKENAEDGKYQSEINRVLRQHMVEAVNKAGGSRKSA
jgi:uncharacterized protein (DUF4415 family)